MRKLTWTEIKALFARAYKDWNEDEAPRMGAALAYYTILSLAPLVVVTIAVAGLVLGKEAAQGQLMQQMADLLGPEGAKAIEAMVAGAQGKQGGVVASVLGGLTLLWGASSVVGELRDSLDKIWDYKKDNAGITGTIKQKSVAMGLVLGCGFLLLVSLAVSAAISAVGQMLSHVLPIPEPVLHALDLLASFIVFALVFAAMFRFLPRAKIEWRDVVPGALFTALLFTIGKFAIGLYLGKASFGSSYGAAGSLVIVLVWVYYSSQIFFFGAEVTHAYAVMYGSKFQQPQVTRPKTADVPVPSDNAMLHPQSGESIVASTAGAAVGLGLVATKIFKTLLRR